MTTLAPVRNQTLRGIRFQVDNVETSHDRFPVMNLSSQLEKKLATTVLALSHDKDFKVIPTSCHPFIAAVSQAFNHHHPLLLTPDVIWLLISQGLSEHINHHAAVVRSRFIKHHGKKELVITTKIPTQTQEWMQAIHEWSLLIRHEVGAEVYHLLECNFSTTTPISQTVSQVVMMDTFRQYFDYSFCGICGIPDIAILGTVDDWGTIRDRVETIANYGLGLDWWTDRLLPICEEFIRTINGQPSLEFWRAIYKPKKIYSGELITGWVADLFPYIEPSLIKSQPVLIRNPILSIPRDYLTANDGISCRCFPSGVSRVPIKLLNLHQLENLALIAGFIGISQHPRWGVLQPELGWCVVHAQ